MKLLAMGTCMGPEPSEIVFGPSIFFSRSKQMWADQLIYLPEDSHAVVYIQSDV